MPTYFYETLPTDGSSPEVFEFRQRVSDPVLTAHPSTGVPVRRVLAAPAIGGKATAPRMGCGMGACDMPGGGGCMSVCGGGGCDN